MRRPFKVSASFRPDHFDIILSRLNKDYTGMKKLTVLSEIEKEEKALLKVMVHMMVELSIGTFFSCHRKNSGITKAT